LKGDEECCGAQKEGWSEKVTAESWEQSCKGKCNYEGQDWSKNPQEQDGHLTDASCRLTFELSGAHADV
jgi:hypothetical protein